MPHGGVVDGLCVGNGVVVDGGVLRVVMDRRVLRVVMDRRVLRVVVYPAVLVLR